MGISISFNKDSPNRPDDYLHKLLYHLQGGQSTQSAKQPHSNSQQADNAMKVALRAKKYSNRQIQLCEPELQRNKIVEEFGQINDNDLAAKLIMNHKEINKDKEMYHGQKKHINTPMEDRSNKENILYCGQ